MQVESRSGVKIDLPTADEDAAINAGVAADSDTFVPDDALFAKMTRRGRPKAAVTKEQVTLRLDPAVLEHFRSFGKGWQTRINEALLEQVRAKR